MEEEGDRGPDEGNLLVRIHVPELNVQKCLQFPRDQLVWDVKQQCLAALPKELKESFNYGLFSPPENGRAGKFLDEERRLGDYPFSGPVGYLELKYKRRVYKTLQLDEKALKSLHTRANLRRFLEHAAGGQVEKLAKQCARGLDPNFHCAETGETPLTLATGGRRPARALLALVNGGALLDFRTARDGATAVHRAVERRSLEALRTLLELGASPNYRDARGLTPLYLAVAQRADAEFGEALLHDHATTGARDLQGWQEVHQACKNGLYRHLEHLLFYGADMNAQNASGNTPLHVCAVNNQEKCAGHLLFRGADRQALNYANQTPYQVAVIAGNMDLAEFIQNYRQEDVVPYRGPPKYNPKRRSAIGLLQRSPSISTLALPPSPCPSDRSSAPFSSASSSLSDGSTTNHLPSGHETDTASIVTDKSLGDQSDIISNSSGVGTANSDATNCSISMPGTTVVCVQSYSPTPADDGHLSLREGDILEVTAATDDGLLEGISKSGQKSGLFPSNCVQEVRFRSHNLNMIVAPPPPPSQSSRVLGRRESTKHFATAPRVRKACYGAALPRTVQLHRGKKGFGFILRGAKATSPLMELTPSEKCPGLQYLDDVDPGGVADRAGLAKGDFLIEINDVDVSSASHEHVVEQIRQSGNFVQMTVVRLARAPPAARPASLGAPPRQCATLPRRLGARPAPPPPRRDPATALSVGRARARSLAPALSKSASAESVRLEALFQRERVAPADLHTESSRFLTSPAKARVYASVSEMKRSKGRKPKAESLFIRNFHSTPDLVQALAALELTKCHKSQEDLAKTRPLPPPTYPPPPPPAAAPPAVVSSFRPEASARLYASPEDVKSVGFRAKGAPCRPAIVRKASSLRAPGAPFRPAGASTPKNPYAQPIRSHSTVGRRRGGALTPVIPEPDYSCSESERESDDDKNKEISPLAARLAAHQLHPVENSGSSGSSTASGGSIPHSFSVDEIQRGRLQLKSSKSYPDDLLKRRAELAEDGDNSSSGVSSDQETAAGGEYGAPPAKARPAVSLAQLPPPLEGDDEPPPPAEFGAAVIAPPPQFCDGRARNVRIVGSVPKSGTR